MAVDLRRAVLADIEKMPTIYLEREVRTQRHIKLFLTTPAGPKILVISVSASDYRAEQQNRSLLRRWERGVA